MLEELEEYHNRHLHPNISHWTTTLCPLIFNNSSTAYSFSSHFVICPEVLVTFTLAGIAYPSHHTLIITPTPCGNVS